MDKREYYEAEADKMLKSLAIEYRSMIVSEIEKQDNPKLLCNLYQLITDYIGFYSLPTNDRSN